MRGRTGLDPSASIGRRTARRALVVSAVGAVVCAFVGVGSAGVAPVTVGSPLTGSFSQASYTEAVTEINTALAEPDTHTTSPVSGTVIGWRVEEAAGGPFFLTVVTPESNSRYVATALSAGETPTGSATQTFTSDLPIKAGQTIGVDNSNVGDKLGYVTAPGSAATEFAPPLTIGSPATGESASGYEIGFNAVVQPLPTVTGVKPHSGSKGRKVTIKGTNFDGTTAVKFGTKKAKKFKVISDTKITAVAPAHHAGVVHVTVYNPGKSAPSKGSKFKFKKSA